MSAPRAVALLSGGMDSSTAAAIVRAEGHVVEALAVDYGQRARAELDAARAVAEALGLARLRVVAVDLAALGGSALTDRGIDVPRDRPDERIGEGIPPTYVPARNTVLLALALAAAEAADADAIVIGVNAIDTSGYPDCRPAFLEAFERVAAEGTRRGMGNRPIRVLAPLRDLGKADIVRRGLALGVPFERTLSCYDPVPEAGAWLHCGRCDACRLRRRGFDEAGGVDPAPRVR